MGTKYVRWEDTKAKARDVDPRSDADREAALAAAGARQEAYVRGHQLAEMRKAAGMTQSQLAAVLSVSQARISKIEHGEISGIDVIRAYVDALGGTLDIVANLGDRSWRVA